MCKSKIVCNLNRQLCKNENAASDKEREKLMQKNKNSVSYAKKGFHKKFNEDQKVCNHCDYTGNYRDALHNISNIRCISPKEIPVVCHNGSNYDCRFIIKELAE